MTTKRCRCGALITSSTQECKTCQVESRLLRDQERKLAELALAARREAQARWHTQECLLRAVAAEASLSRLGKALGVPRQTVRYRIKQARQALRASESASEG